MSSNSQSLDDHDRAWRRAPGELWFKRKPDFCSLTLVPIVEEHPETAGPTFTTRFRRPPVPMPVTDFMNIDHVSLKMDFGSVGKIKFVLKATEHGCDECPHPRVVRLKYEVKAPAAEAFWAAVHRSKYFLWVFSTESYEGRMLIDHPSGKVRAKFHTPRLVH